MFQKILVAVDKSVVSEHVFDEALAIAKASQASLMLIHVLSPGEEGYPMPIYPGPDSVYPGLHEEAARSYAQQWDIYEQEGLKLLRSLAEQATAAGIAVEYSQNTGDPGRTICAIARNWDADLIVMGRRGLSGISELIMGSVSNYVLHHTSCSVLTVQGKALASSVQNA